MKKENPKTEKALFAAGCFWEVEEAFRTVKGMVKTTVGYTGGNDKKYPNPTYEQVSSGKTGFAESCLIEFNPKEISYMKLLEIFWGIHNPTQLNRQGPDFGTQYRTAIFYFSPKQKKDAETSKKAEQKKYKDKIVTEIKKAGKFHRAEEYHQHYLINRGMKTCRI
jgi:peptide-methionine (S)-S-oxide reductase